MMERLLIACFLLIFFNSVYGQINESISSNLDSVFHSNVSASPGYLIAVIQDDEYIFQKSYGLSNLEHEISIDLNTSFNIASLSKQITAAAIALLMIEGKIHFDDLVSDYLEDFPFTEDSIQVKHLIYMTSGINDYYYNSRGNNSDWSSLNFFSIDTALAASYSSNILMYKPGSQWSYSNVNYMLLTKIVEKISKISFAEFVQERIFRPLGMENSIVNDDIFQVIPNRALGYNYRTKDETDWMIESGYLKDQGEGFLQIHRNSPHYGGSGIYTTMNDWKKWIANFSTKKLGGEDFYNLMHHTMKFEHSKSNDAFGLVIDSYKGKDIVWYEGGDWGYSAFMVRFPESKTTIVCFSNLGTGNTKSKVWQVYDILFESGIIK